MSDITTVWVAGIGQGDWSIEGGALASGDDLATAVLISLFTDRQADADDVLPDGSDDRRGWWGDLGQDIKIGSRLWLLARSRLNEDVAKKAALYAKEALAWLITDSIASAVAVTAVPDGTRQLDISVTITRDTGSQAYKFSWAWSQLG